MNNAYEPVAEIGKKYTHKLYETVVVYKRFISQDRKWEEHTDKLRYSSIAEAKFRINRFITQIQKDTCKIIEAYINTINVNNLNNAI